MILGISAGGRAKGQTSAMVRMILEESGLEHEFVSLSGKSINGCSGCLACAATNLCAVKDDWGEIAAKMVKADAIVFGAPVYSGTMNATGHAFLERTYSLRHGRFLLGRKYGVIVTTGADGNGSHELAKRMMNANKISILDTVNAKCGMAPCYHCGCGHDCLAGHAIKRDSVEPLKEITPDLYPHRFENNELAQVKVKRAARLLSTALGNQ